MAPQSLTLDQDGIDLLREIFVGVKNVFVLQEGFIDLALRGEVRPEAAEKLRAAGAAAAGLMAKASQLLNYRPPSVH